MQTTSHASTLPLNSSAGSIEAQARDMMTEAATIGEQVRALVAGALALKEQNRHLEAFPTTTQPETSLDQETQTPQQNRNPSAKQAPQNTSSKVTQQLSQLQASDPAKIRTCPHCKALSHNSEWSATDIARHIRAVSETDFDAAHKQFKDWGGKYILPPGGCIQFLMAPMNVRRNAIYGQSDTCPVCLAIPKIKHSSGQCRGKHVLRERLDGKYNSLCLYSGCDHHQLICLQHWKMNQNHPHNGLFYEGTVRRFFDKYPEHSGTDVFHISLKPSLTSSL